MYVAFGFPIEFKYSFSDFALFLILWYISLFIQIIIGINDFLNLCETSQSDN